MLFIINYMNIWISEVTPNAKHNVPKDIKLEAKQTTSVLTPYN